jgi:hypothetical protein
MPRISEFYGIAIYMYYRDHPPPHFHAIYGEHEAKVDIGSASIIEGYLPRRAAALVREWASAHQQELQRDWELARLIQPLIAIVPLD